MTISVIRALLNASHEDRAAKSGYERVLTQPTNSCRTARTRGACLPSLSVSQPVSCRLSRLQKSLSSVESPQLESTNPLI